MEQHEAESEEIKPTVDRLWGNGFSIRQLHSFFSAKANAWMTTSEVVREVVIPETADRQCAYMQGEFMEQLGGPKGADKLVSHSWSSKFVTTCSNIFTDVDDVNDSRKLTKHKRRWLAGYGKPDPDWLNELSDQQRDGTIYWLCIFAVNEHKSICGDCFQCNPGPEKKWSQQDYAQELCKGCAIKKFNPCACGAQKIPESSPAYEIDKFAFVVGRVKELVVSVDEDFATLSRVWVVSEIATAMERMPVRFRLASSYLPWENFKMLEEGKPLFPLVEDCDATSLDDKKRILDDIRRKKGGIDAFNDFVQTAVEINFGRFHRLKSLSLDAQHALQRIKTLVVDGGLTNLGEYGADGKRCFVDLEQMGICAQTFKLLSNLEHLRMKFSYFNGEHFKELSMGLCELINLRSLDLSFYDCKNLKTFDAIALSSGDLKQLRSLKLDISSCKKLHNLDELGRSLAVLRQLQHFSLSVTFCDQLHTFYELGKGIMQLKKLQTFYLNHNSCNALPRLIQAFYSWEYTSRCEFIFALQLTYGCCNVGRYLLYLFAIPFSLAWFPFFLLMWMPLILVLCFWACCAPGSSGGYLGRHIDSLDQALFYITLSPVMLLSGRLLQEALWCAVCYLKLCLRCFEDSSVSPSNQNSEAPEDESSDRPLPIQVGVSLAPV